jgi:hypothetical protein
MSSNYAVLAFCVLEQVFLIQPDEYRYMESREMGFAKAKVTRSVHQAPDVIAPAL